MEGKRPQSSTSSEFAAFLDLHIVPELRKAHEEDPQGASFEADCLAFAIELGLPPQHRHLVQLPAYISLDNAPIHKWARQLMCNPRMDQEEIDAYVRAALRKPDALGTAFTAIRGFERFTVRGPGPQPHPPAPPCQNSPSVNLKAHLQRAGAASEEELQEMREAQRTALNAWHANEVKQFEIEHREWLASSAVHNRVEQLLQRLPAQDGLTWMQRTLRQLANERKEARVLLPQQFMPLVKTTPDIHCPVEHMIGTLKAKVKQKAWEHVMDADLYDAAVWQRWLNEAVAEYGNGVNGRKHISGSFRKQKCICEILRTPQGEFVVVKFVFGDGGANPTGRKRSEWEVAGTGGGWIPVAKWT